MGRCLSLAELGGKDEVGAWGVCGEPRVCGDVRIETLAMMEEGNGNPDVNDRLTMKISQRSVAQYDAMRFYGHSSFHFIPLKSDRYGGTSRMDFLSDICDGMGWDGMGW